MKIEETFKDLKSLLGIDKLMYQKRHWMEQMVSPALIEYAIGLVVGETLHSFPSLVLLVRTFVGTSVFHA